MPHSDTIQKRGFQRWYQARRRGALRRLIERHPADYIDLLDDEKARNPFTPSRP